MKRFQILRVALLGVFVAVFAVDVVVASTASAVIVTLLAEWLNTGNPITTTQNGEAEGEVSIISTNGGGFGVKSRVLCSGIFDGNVGPNGEGNVSELLSLAGVAISKTALTGTALSCTNDENCTEPLVWAEGLPLKTRLQLMEEGAEVFFSGIVFGGGYYVECLVLGITINELCSSSEAAGQISNNANGTVDGDSTDAFQVLAGLTLGSCTLGGAESAEVIGLGTGLLTSGAALTASST